jgi:hypothetical protein
LADNKGVSPVHPFPPLRRVFTGFVVIASLLLVGCDQLGIESAATVAARKDAEGKAIGAGCRHAARSVEQCYANNKRAEKAAVFAGWKEMNDYMRENNIQAVPAAPEVAVAAGPDTDAADSADEKAGEKAGDKAADKPAGKAAAKPAAKPAAKH